MIDEAVRSGAFAPGLAALSTVFELLPAGSHPSLTRARPELDLGLRRVDPAHQRQHMVRLHQPGWHGASFSKVGHQRVETVCDLADMAASAAPYG